MLKDPSQRSRSILHVQPVSSCLCSASAKRTAAAESKPSFAWRTEKVQHISHALTKVKLGWLFHDDSGIWIHLNFHARSFKHVLPCFVSKTGPDTVNTLLVLAIGSRPKHAREARVVSASISDLWQPKALAAANCTISNNSEPATAIFGSGIRGMWKKKRPMVSKHAGIALFPAYPLPRYVDSATDSTLNAGKTSGTSLGKEFVVTFQEQSFFSPMDYIWLYPLTKYPRRVGPLVF